MTGWASEEFCHVFLTSNLPSMVRLLLLPGWVRRYEYFKGLVSACAGDSPVRVFLDPSFIVQNFQSLY